MSESVAVAIDGPVASGKTTVGTLVARWLAWPFLDTGIMYRAVAWAAIQKEIDLEDEEALTSLASEMDIRIKGNGADDTLLVDGQDITNDLRHPKVERAVSLVAKVSGVRTAMVAQQQAIAQSGAIVMVGRDIGTVVLPKAEIKIFLKASVQLRAQRRYRELLEGGYKADVREVMSELLRRDQIDSQRTDSPLRPADDAILIETDDLGIEEVVQKILSLVRGD